MADILMEAPRMDDDDDVVEVLDEVEVPLMDALLDLYAKMPDEQALSELKRLVSTNRDAPEVAEFVRSFAFTSRFGLSALLVHASPNAARLIDLAPCVPQSLVEDAAGMSAIQLYDCLVPEQYRDIGVWGLEWASNTARGVFEPYAFVLGLEHDLRSKKPMDDIIRDVHAQRRILWADSANRLIMGCIATHKAWWLIPYVMSAYKHLSGEEIMSAAVLLAPFAEEIVEYFRGRVDEPTRTVALVGGAKRDREGVSAESKAKRVVPTIPFKIVLPEGGMQTFMSVLLWGDMRREWDLRLLRSLLDRAWEAGVDISNRTLCEILTTFGASRAVFDHFPRIVYEPTPHARMPPTGCRVASPEIDAREKDFEHDWFMCPDVFEAFRIGRYAKLPNDGADESLRIPFMIPGFASIDERLRYLKDIEEKLSNELPVDERRELQRRVIETNDVFAMLYTIVKGTLDMVDTVDDIVAAGRLQMANLCVHLRGIDMHFPRDDVGLAIAAYAYDDTDRWLTMALNRNYLSMAMFLIPLSSEVAFDHQVPEGLNGLTSKPENVDLFRWCIFNGVFVINLRTELETQQERYTEILADARQAEVEAGVRREMAAAATAEAENAQRAAAEPDAAPILRQVAAQATLNALHARVEAAAAVQKAERMAQSAADNAVDPKIKDLVTFEMMSGDDGMEFVEFGLHLDRRRVTVNTNPTEHASYERMMRQVDESPINWGRWEQVLEMVYETYNPMFFRDYTGIVPRYPYTRNTNPMVLAHTFDKTSSVLLDEIYAANELLIVMYSRGESMSDVFECLAGRAYDSYERSGGWYPLNRLIEFLDLPQTDNLETEMPSTHEFVELLADVLRSCITFRQITLIEDLKLGVRELAKCCIMLSRRGVVFRRGEMEVLAYHALNEPEHDKLEHELTELRGIVREAVAEVRRRMDAGPDVVDAERVPKVADAERAVEAAKAQRRSEVAKAQKEVHDAEEKHAQKVADARFEWKKAEKYHEPGVEELRYTFDVLKAQQTADVAAAQRALDAVRARRTADVDMAQHVLEIAKAQRVVDAARANVATAQADMDALLDRPDDGDLPADWSVELLHVMGGVDLYAGQERRYAEAFDATRAEMLARGVSTHERALKDIRLRVYKLPDDWMDRVMNG